MLQELFRSLQQQMLLDTNEATESSRILNL